MSLKNDFDKLCKLGCKIFKLNSELTPMEQGWNKTDFVFETEYKEGQNYGIVGGSIHTDKEGKTGKLVFADLDIKEKVSDGNGGFVDRANPEAATRLVDVKSLVGNRDYYLADTKTGGLHMGVLSNEDLSQGVALYENQDCPKLRVDIRTQDGYVVAIAPGYSITTIPECFGRVIPEFEPFMYSMSFSKTGNSGGAKHTGTLSDEFKQKARDAMEKLDIKYFPELGTEKVSTHDVISFWAMSCRALKISEDDTVEKIRFLLGRFDTSKNTAKTETEIRKMYRKEYEGFDDSSVAGPETKLKLDDYLIAGRLMELYHFKTLEKTKEILFWNNGKYWEGGEEVISKRSRKIADGVKKSNIAEVKAIIQDETGYLNRSEFDGESHIINMKNIMFNLKTGQTMEHTPEYLSRVKIPTYYDPAAKCPRFEKFLASSLEDDEGKIRTIWEMIALCFIKDSALVEKAFVNTGPGSNGKGILSGILAAMLGMDNISAKSIHSLENNRFSISGLEGKLANICSEIGKGGISTTENLKSIISGDLIDGEKKGLDAYSFMPYATLIFSANEIPVVDDTSDGFARKFELIEWEKSFYGDERDHSVKNIKNTPSELSGIFNKMIPVAKELLETHELKFGRTVADAKLQWIARSDSVQRFLDEKTYRDAKSFSSAVVVFSEYIRFCSEHKFTHVSDQRFNKKVKKNGYEKIQKKIGGINIWRWAGLKLSRSETKKPGAEEPKQGQLD